MGGAARADLRQELPAHLRGVPRSRSPCPDRGVQRPLRGARGAGGAGLPARGAGPRPGAARRPALARSTAAIIVGVLFIAFLAVPRPDRRQRQQEPATTRSRRRRDGSTTSQAAKQAQQRQKASSTKPTANTVSVKVVPSQEVWVCLVNATGQRKIDAQVLAAGQSRGPFRSKRFRDHGRQRRRRLWSSTDDKRNVPETLQAGRLLDHDRRREVAAGVPHSRDCGA